MNINGIKPELQLRPGMFSTTQHRDDNAFFNEKVGGKPASLNSYLTWMLGSQSEMHSICSLEGYYDMIGNPSTEVIDANSGGQYFYHVIGDLYKASELALTNATANLGYGHSKFTLVFKDAQFKKTQVICSPRMVYCRVESDPRPVGNGYEYDLVLISSKFNAVLPASETIAGNLWIDLFSATSEERSDGSGSNVMYPGKVKNQIGHLQKKVTWGNHHNDMKIMDFSINVDGKQINSWMSWFLWNFEKQWMTEKENMYWYSTYNRNSNNEITLKDSETGEPVMLGSGLLEQIQNVSTYTSLSYNQLLDKLTAAYFGQYDTEGMSITLHTGTGGYREFNDMMYREFGERAKVLNISTDSSKFLTGSGYNLAMTGYFDTVYFVDGYTIKVKKNRTFDLGRVAKVSPKHPKTGLPLESYRMVFIDDADVDGQPNLQFINYVEKGWIHSWTGGLTNAPKDLMALSLGDIRSGSAPFRASTKGEGAYTRKQSFGINLRRANRCFMLEQVSI